MAGLESHIFSPFCVEARAQAETNSMHELKIGEDIVKVEVFLKSIKFNPPD